MNIQTPENRQLPQSLSQSLNQTAAVNSLANNDTSTLNNIKLTSPPSALNIRPAFQPLLTASFKMNFIIQEANKNLSTFFQSSNSLSHSQNKAESERQYSDGHPFSDHFFDNLHSNRQLKEHCSKLCAHTVSALESELKNHEKLNAFKKGGTFRIYLLKRCSHPESAVPLLKETAIFCRQLVESLENSMDSYKHVEETLAIFPPHSIEDYQCAHGTRARLFEALSFFNLNNGNATTLPRYLTQQISNTLQEYISTAIIEYQLTRYVRNGLQVHLHSMVTSLLIGTEEVIKRDGFALLPLKEIPAVIIYKLLTEAPIAIKQQAKSLTESLAVGATGLLNEIEQCRDFNAPSAGSQIHSIREHPINELMKEYIAFDPAGGQFIKLDDETCQPKYWNTQAIEKQINSTLYKHLLDKPSEKPIGGTYIPYSQLFNAEQMDAVATHLAEYPNHSRGVMGIDESLFPLYVMATVKLGGSPLYSLMITQRIGELLHQKENPTQIETDSLINLFAGFGRLRDLAKDDSLTPLAKERLKKIIQAIEPVITQSIPEDNDDSALTQNSEGYPQLYTYLLAPKDYFRPRNRVKKSQALAAELISGNAPVSIWDNLLTIKSFKKDLKSGLHIPFSAQPYPQCEALILRLQNHNQTLLRQYLSALLPNLMKAHDTETLQRILQLPIQTKHMMAPNKDGLNIVQLAAKHNKPEVIKALHARGIPVERLLKFNRFDNKGFSAVMWAVKKNHPDIIQAFSDIGATAKQLEPEARRLQISATKDTLTITAAKLNHHQALKALIDAGLTERELLLTGPYNEKPHYIAAELGHHKIVALLGNALSLKTLLQSKERLTLHNNILEAAITGGQHGAGNHTRVIETLCQLDTERKWINNHYACMEHSPLNYSIINNKNNAIKTFIRMLTVDELLTPCPQRGRLPSHYHILNSRRYKNHNVFSGLKDKRIEMDSLITLDNNGESPLHIAARLKKSHHIHDLKELGITNASLSVVPKSQLSPIHLAVKQRSSITLQALLDLNPDLDQINLERHVHRPWGGRTALEIAEKYGYTEIITILQRAISNTTT